MCDIPVQQAEERQDHGNREKTIIVAAAATFNCSLGEQSKKRKPTWSALIWFPCLHFTNFRINHIVISLWTRMHPPLIDSTALLLWTNRASCNRTHEHLNWTENIFFVSLVFVCSSSLFRFFHRTWILIFCDYVFSIQQISEPMMKMIERTRIYCWK